MKRYVGLFHPVIDANGNEPKELEAAASAEMVREVPAGVAVSRVPNATGVPAQVAKRLADTSVVNVAHSVFI